MIRGALLTIILVGVIPLCLAFGAWIGFYLLLGLYAGFGVDFPTEISILVLLMPGLISIVLASRFLAHRIIAHD